MDLWRDLRGFVGLPDDEGASTDGAAVPPAAQPSEFENLHSLKPERLPGNRVVGFGIRGAWALVRFCFAHCPQVVHAVKPPCPPQVAVLVAVLLSSNTVHNRYAIRRVWGDTRLKAERLLNGADAEGWSRCSAKCGWGTQTRQLSSCTARESRPCWGDGIVGCDGVCGSAVGYDCLHVCGGRNVPDDCGVCAGLNKAKDCAGVCFGASPRR